MTKHFIILAIFVSGLAACGVRGKPQPPLTPPEIGRGRPTFNGTADELKFQSVPTPETQKK